MYTDPLEKRHWRSGGTELSKMGPILPLLLPPEEGSGVVALFGFWRQVLLSIALAVLEFILL